VNLKLFVGIALTLLSGIFMLQNTAVVEIRFLFWTLAMSRALMYLLLIVVGVFLGWVLTSARAARHKPRPPR